MTKRERAAHAARWRRIAGAFETCRQCARPHYALAGLCGALISLVGYGRYWKRGLRAPVLLFAPLDDLASTRIWWPFDREGDDCRVIAAGLIAAMYEAGDLDE